MRKLLLGRGVGIGRGRMTADPVDSIDKKSTARRGPIHWIILSGVLLVAAIAIGTAIMVGNFRERTLDSSKRELENTVLLLARHFDRQLKDFEVVQKDIVAQMQLTGIASSDAFKGQMSTLDMHEVLRAKVTGSSDVAGVNVFDSDGVLINSSEMWPVPDVKVADRAYFKALKSGSALAPVLIELVQSRFSRGWAIVISRKISAPNGEFLGLVARGIAPANFEEFFASVALGEGASIALFHSDGTLLVRHPHVESMIGRNFITGPVHQQILSKSDHGTMRLESPIDGWDRLASARHLSHFPISIIAATTVSAALADWRDQTRLLIGMAGLLVLVIVVILTLIVRLLLKQHQLFHRRLAVERRQLSIAVNNISAGPRSL